MSGTMPALTRTRSSAAEEPTTSAAARWPAGRYMTIGVGMTLFLIFGVGVWAAYAMIAGAVIAPATLQVESSRKTVDHLEGGVVADILARDGDFVREGDILVRLDRTSIAANYEIVAGQLDEMMARQARLDSEQLGLDEMLVSDKLALRVTQRPQAAQMLEGQQTLFEARRETLDRQLNQLNGRIAQTRNEIEGAESQIESIDRQLELIREELTAKREMLRKGLAQKPQVIALEREEAELSGRRGSLMSNIAQLEGRISEIDIRALELKSQRIEQAITELRDMTARIAELEERQKALEDQLTRTDIKAPQSGVVHDMVANTIGGVVRPGQPILYIVPTEDRLVVEARVDPAFLDEVREGQHTKVLFTGFNSRTTPEINGSVLSVAPDVLTDERTGISFYKVKIDITEEEWTRLRDSIDRDLQPGMPAEAHMQTGERSAASYLLKPLLDAWRVSLIEQ